MPCESYNFTVKACPVYECSYGMPYFENYFLLTYCIVKPFERRLPLTCTIMNAVFLRNQFPLQLCFKSSKKEYISEVKNYQIRCLIFIMQNLRNVVSSYNTGNILMCFRSLKSGLLHIFYSAFKICLHLRT